MHIIILLSSIGAMSQGKDSTAISAGAVITEKFPATRIFDVQYQQLGKANYKSKVFGEDAEKTQVKNHSRLKVTANLPIYQSKSRRFFITNTLRYKFEAYDYGTTYSIPSQTYLSRPNQQYHYFAGSLSGTYFSSLFKKPVLYNATVTVDGNQKDVQRVKGFVSATAVLRKNEHTTMTVGVVALVDPSSIIPFSPTFSYEHRFKDLPWKLDIILPQRVLLTRSLLENGRISIGTELNNENYYLTINDTGFNGVYEFNQLELRNGITYEYIFLKNCIATFRGGITNVITARITERGAKTSKYVAENKQDAQPFFLLGLSYNPF
ncbi:hypothetical protein [Flavobacterium rhizosphaerae]|uniref:Uncharacterized protein n=1 Tax=Flavobacterium rhizosphaerae TaxID=3163298 RepID=A0ABW8Z1H4_9FLAO